MDAAILNTLLMLAILLTVCATVFVNIREQNARVAANEITWRNHRRRERDKRIAELERELGIGCPAIDPESKHESAFAAPVTATESRVVIPVPGCEDCEWETATCRNASGLVVAVEVLYTRRCHKHRET